MLKVGANLLTMIFLFAKGPFWMFWDDAKRKKASNPKISIIVVVKRSKMECKSLFNFRCSIKISMDIQRRMDFRPTNRQGTNKCWLWFWMLIGINLPFCCWSKDMCFLCESIQKRHLALLNLFTRNFTLYLLFSLSNVWPIQTVHIWMNLISRWMASYCSLQVQCGWNRRNVKRHTTRGENFGETNAKWS